MVWATRMWVTRGTLLSMTPPIQTLVHSKNIYYNADASALWWDISSAKDEHVTDETVCHFINFDDDDSSYDITDFDHELYDTRAEYDSDRANEEWLRDQRIYENDPEDSDDGVH